MQCQEINKHKLSKLAGTDLIPYSIFENKCKNTARQRKSREHNIFSPYINNIGKSTKRDLNK